VNNYFETFLELELEMNTVILMGNLTRDPDIKQVNAKGKEVTLAAFTLAVSRYYTTANGQKEQDTVFVPCEAWDSGAVTIGKYLVKGSRMLIEGTLKSDTWETDGQKKSRLKVRVGRFEMLGGKRKSDNDNEYAERTEQQEEPVKSPVADGDNDIPF